MKKVIFLSVFVCLLAFSAFAQTKTTDFSGTWELDKSKSKLDERMRVESMTMTVTQTETELKVETQTKRMPPPEGAMQGGGQGGGMRMGGGMGRGGFGGGDGTTTYTLDGKESKTTQESPVGAIPVTLKAKIDGSKLNLTQTRTLSTQMGEFSITTKETWTLSEDGKTLTVKRDMETPRGTNSSEMVFTKK